MHACNTLQARQKPPPERIASAPSNKAMASLGTTTDIAMPWLCARQRSVGNALHAPHHHAHGKDNRQGQEQGPTERRPSDADCRHCQQVVNARQRVHKPG
jgi:hypothetical protein